MTQALGVTIYIAIHIPYALLEIYNVVRRGPILSGSRSRLWCGPDKPESDDLSGLWSVSPTSRFWSVRYLYYGPALLLNGWVVHLVWYQFPGMVGYGAFPPYLVQLAQHCSHSQLRSLQLLGKWFSKVGCHQYGETSTAFRLWSACRCWFPHATLSGTSIFVRSWKGILLLKSL